MDALTSREAVLNGARWRFILQLGQQALSVAATLVLARLLVPADFGIIAIATSVLTFFQLGTAWGFGTSVVKRERVDEAFLRSIFTTSVLVALPLCLAGAAVALPVASLVGRPDAAGAVAALMPVIALQTVSGVPNGLLQRRMQFKQPAVLGLFATLVYVVVQIVLAASGFGYWSVVIGQLVMAAIQLVGAFWLVAWLPRLGSPLPAVREEGRFSAGVLVGESGVYLLKNLDYWLVGAVMGAASLGAYYVAFVLPSILRLRVAAVAQAVLLPVFSRLRDEKPRAQRLYKEVLELQAAVAVPAMTGVAVLAPEVVRVFFGPQWQAAVEPLRWIAVASIFDLLSGAHVTAAYASGRVGRNNLVIAARLMVLIACLSVVLRGSPSLAAVGAAVAVASFLGFLLGQWLVARPLGLHIGLAMKPLLSIFLAAALMGAVVLATKTIVLAAGAGSLVTLLVATAAGVLFYLAFGFLLSRDRFRVYVRAVVSVIGVRGGRGVKLLRR